MSDFIYKTLEDLTMRVKVGFVGSVNNFYCKPKNGIPIIRTTDINNIDFNRIKYITKEFHFKNKKSQLKKGDLIIARHGDNGNAIIYDHNRDAQVLNSVIIEPDQKKISSELLKIYFDSPFVKKQISGSVKGSVQGVINTKHISNLLLNISSDINYHFVTKILTNIDKKIELNNRINTELEAMAKTLYDYWFVQFDFPFDFAQGKPSLKGKPYKSSGGKMVFNKTLKREIPEGWEVLELGNLVSIINNNVLPDEVEPTTPYIGLEHIPRKTIILSKWEMASKVSSNKCLFEKYDILFGKIRPYFHKIGLSFINGITSTDTIVLRVNKNEFLGLVLETVSTNRFIKTATASSTGTKMPRANWKVLQHYKIPVPPSELLHKYQDLFTPIIDEIESSIYQNKELTQLRDWLLPMLMNGQVTVK